MVFVIQMKIECSRYLADRGRSDLPGGRPLRAVGPRCRWDSFIRSTLSDRDPAVDGINFTSYLCLVVFLGSFGDAVACVYDWNRVIAEIKFRVFVVVCCQENQIIAI
jgi:hypothetical protein